MRHIFSIVLVKIARIKHIMFFVLLRGILNIFLATINCPGNFILKDAKSEQIAYAIKLQQKPRTSNNVLLKCNVSLENICGHFYDFIIAHLFSYSIILKFMLWKSRRQKDWKISTRGLCILGFKIRERRG